MDDKEFKKLHREDLIEIIYQYQRREQRLIQENAMLRSQLEDRRIRMEKTGSIAEAALALSGIFEAAQKAADSYIESVKANAAERGTVPQRENKMPERRSTAAEAAAPRIPQPQKMPNASAVSQQYGEKAPASEKRIPEQTVEEKQKSAPVQKEFTDKNAKRMELPFLNRTEKRRPDSQKTADPSTEKEIREEKVLEPVKPAKPERQPEPVKPAAQIPVKPEARPAAETPRSPQTPSPAPKTEKMQEKPQTSANGEKPRDIDTDAFIASLKDYLGM